MDNLAALGAHWCWWALGLVLATAEIIVPGMFLIWMAMAAMATGLLVWLLPISGAVQIVTFAILSIITVFSSRRLLRRHPVTEADPLMNQRTQRLIGETAIVTEAISGGTGRIRLGDSEWLASGPDAAIGTQVRITGADGTVLQVSASSDEQ